jgi:hypothetical protein|tara:strand:+ start:68 stop:505 length:438 start_codon:yes stop_codon:yes gene_type:complete
MRVILAHAIFLFGVIFSQTNAKALKVVEHKNSWKAYRSGIEIPKSHFFRIVNDEYNRDKSLLYEKNFMVRKFKLSCFMCGNSSLGLMSLAADNQKMIKITLYGYLITNILRRFIKEDSVDITFDEALDLAKEYNDSLNGESNIAI